MTDSILEIPGTFNLRDLGGLKANDNKTVKAHKLLRGGYLTDISDGGVKMIEDYGIKTVIDLRSSSEISQYPDRLSSSINYLNIPLFDDDTTSSTKSLAEINRAYANDNQYGYERMMRSYRKFVTDPHAINAFREFFYAVAEFGQQDNGILFHCSAGKDRTGICTYLLLSILGVNQTDIKLNYLESNDASEKRIQWRLDEAKKMKLGRDFVKSISDLIVVNDDYLEQATSIINEVYGGLSEFIFNEVGLDNSVIIKIRNNFLEHN
ncbi:tyrosine-protein phosphatase [Lentilactobacillus kosonis]|uniref:Protein tyrosine/serine phosphatase n=1 Tax=Lentilactobacillus kosonis TaxID=2810561 RepID=A0A401FMV9_9LACO|nr:tyrosine-protein phosphatase [Lentilactobacillus kosonis]GAY73608.1 protein tyrosine/serine phosphatase [Lentilactobacillus kosonis]